MARIYINNMSVLQVKGFIKFGVGPTYLYINKTVER